MKEKEKAMAEWMIASPSGKCVFVSPLFIVLAALMHASTPFHPNCCWQKKEAARQGTKERRKEKKPETDTTASQEGINTSA